MRTTNAEFWKELTGLESNEKPLPKSDEILSEDIEPDASLEDNDADDSDLSIQTLINVMIKNDLPDGVGTRKGGALTSIVEAENTGLDIVEPVQVECVEKRIDGEDDIVQVEDRGRGRRKKMANKLYAKFWRHNDDDDSDDDTLLP